MSESLFNKVSGLGPATFLQKRLCHRCFPVNFAKIFKNIFFIEHYKRLLLLLQFILWRMLNSVLGQFSPRKFAPNPKIYSNPNLNPNPNRGNCPDPVKFRSCLCTIECWSTDNRFQQSVLEFNKTENIYHDVCYPVSLSIYYVQSGCWQLFGSGLYFHGIQ